LSSIDYSIGDLQNLINIGIRDNMLTSNLRDRWFPLATEECLKSLMENGNPIENTMYKNMNIDKLKNHIFTASSSNKSKQWNSTHQENYNVLIDEGKTNVGNTSGYNFWLSKGSILNPYKKYTNFNNYQPYFYPKNRISDLCTMNSIGPVGLKVNANTKQNLSVCYSDTFNDNDLTCITCIVDIGKNSKVTLEENFENKKGSAKLYNIVYLIKEGSELTIDRRYDLLNKDNSMNVVESRIIQFPKSKCTFNVSGEGSKHTQDIVDIDIYNDCFTSVLGSFNCFDNVTNNMYIHMHHKGKNSFSRVDVKSIIDDSAHSSFLGCITVDKEAEGVDAELFNKNLLLSNKATAITEPQLDINTKEINCKHGCTVSNIDKEELYYLETKGIDKFTAEETLKKCFLTI